jgi:hypothetical protein
MRHFGDIGTADEGLWSGAGEDYAEEVIVLGG